MKGKNELDDERWLHFKFPRMRVIKKLYPNGITAYIPQRRRWFRWKNIMSTVSFTCTVFCEEKWSCYKLTEHECNSIIRAYKRWIAFNVGNSTYVEEVLHSE